MESYCLIERVNSLKNSEPPQAFAAFFKQQEPALFPTTGKFLSSYISILNAAHNTKAIEGCDFVTSKPKIQRRLVIGSYLF